MSNDNKKKKPPLDPSFDPSVPEDGVALPEDERELRDLYNRHLPSAADIAVTARDAFGDKLPEELLQNEVGS